MFSDIINALLTRKAEGGVQAYSPGQRLKTAAIVIFLAPLIVILGTIDILTGGRTRSWP